MTSTVLFDSLKVEAQRLLRYRYLLAIALIANGLLICKVPLSQLRPTVSANNSVASEAPTPDSMELSPQSSQPMVATVASQDSAQSAVQDVPIPKPDQPQMENILAGYYVAAPSTLPTISPVPRPPAQNRAINLDVPAKDLAGGQLPAMQFSSSGLKPHLQQVTEPARQGLENGARLWLAGQLLAAVTTPTASDNTVSSVPEGASPTSQSATPSKAPASDPPELAGEPVLHLRNPVTNGGPVHFLVDGRSFSLFPGEAHQFPGNVTRLVQYHRGGQFDDAEISVVDGGYKFRVTQQGWRLDRQLNLSE